MAQKLKQKQNATPQQKQKKTDAAVKWHQNKTQLFVMVAVLLLTYVCYSPALSDKKEFTNWDDPTYVTEQPIIKSTDGENIKKMFKPENHVSLNYHPITMLSLAYNYKYSELKPHAYFFTNIIIHLLNTFLVFYFLYLLSGKRFMVGAIAAALFGLHPMHAESVAWISERKDVLYCFFFLLSCITHIKYLDTNKKLFLLYTFLFFVLSCLSKAMAVVLPVVLLLIDFYKSRKVSGTAIIEKIPFFLISVYFGYTATHIQSSGAIADFQVFTLAQRFMFASYGYLMYWIKLFFPFQLSAFYPYPTLNESGGVGSIFYLAPILTFVLIVLPLWYTYKKNPNYFKLTFFGIGFFAVTVALVLQFISVGAAIMADRYSYLPYIGAAFIIAVLADDWMQRSKTLVLTILVGAGLVFSYLCFERVKVWNDNETLWTDVIEKFPYDIVQTGNVVQVKTAGVETAHKNRGNYYADKGLLDKAYADYEILVRAQTKDAGVYSNMGNLHGLKKEFTKALDAYSKAINLKPEGVESYLNRGITYSMMQQYDKAIADYSAAIKINPTIEKIYVNRAYTYLTIGNYRGCIDDCNYVLQRNPNEANMIFYRGTAYVNSNKLAEAIQDLQKATQLNPANGNAWYNLSVSYNKSGMFKPALDAALQAQKNGYQITQEYLTELQSKI
jgi:tetratricopeptide (TPR) repeat protein